MGKTTNIPWCDSTWNWAWGCDKVSPGCKNCYITNTAPMRVAGQKHGDPRVIASDATFDAPLAWNKRPYVCDTCGYFSDDRRTKGGLLYCAKCECFRHFHRRRVFSLSLGDWLDPEIPVPALARALDIIRRCEAIDFLLCTKRPELFKNRMHRVNLSHPQKGFNEPLVEFVSGWIDGFAPKNVWAITSVEDQERTSRIEHLLKIPAAVHGLSIEPLLEPIDLGRAFQCGYYCDESVGHVDHPFWSQTKTQIDWIIVGGESGKNARPCNVEWIRSVKAECESAGVPVFVKQLGAKPYIHGVAGLDSPDGDQYWHPLSLSHPKGGDMSEWPEDLRVRHFPAERQGGG